MGSLSGIFRNAGVVDTEKLQAEYEPGDTELREMHTAGRRTIEFEQATK